MTATSLRWYASQRSILFRVPDNLKAHTSFAVGLFKSRGALGEMGSPGLKLLHVDVDRLATSVFRERKRSTCLGDPRLNSASSGVFLPWRWMPRNWKCGG